MTTPAREVVFPLGQAVQFFSSSEPALDAAREHWGAWPRLFGEMPLSFHIEVHEGPEASAPPGCRMAEGELLFYSDPANLASFSAEVKSGLLRVSSRTLAKKRWFVHHFLEALVLTALDTLFFDPLHAACVARNGCGVLLAGDSGAGKTTLAYACAKAGWTLISEEGAHLAGDAERSLVGASRVFHLREGAQRLFPELEDWPLMPAANGKLAIQVDAAAAGMKTEWRASAGPTVFLSRRAGPAELRPFAPEVALMYFLQTSRRPNREESEKRLRELLSRGCHLLEYERVEDAVAILDGLA
jgi:hypothetical protein